MNRSTHGEALLQELPDPSATDGPSWLAHLRRDAAAHLREHGFPTKKHEGWRFTPVAPITSVPFAPAEADQASATELEPLLERFRDGGSWCLPVVNGRPRPDLAPALPGGVEATSLARQLTEEPAAVEAHLGKYARAEHFAALNAAMFDDGLVLRVKAGGAVPPPVHLIHVAVPGEAPTAAYPRLLVLVDENAEASLVETFFARPGAKHLTNAVSELVVASGARLEHVRLHEGADHAFHVAHVAVHQAEGSRYESRVFTLGGALLRLDLDVALDGEGAECLLDGAYHVTGSEHVDHHTLIDHRRPRCTSHEVYRGVLDGRSRAVFDGTIVVERDAQHTSAHQENRNLLLSDDAGVNTKPHLRIDADDVKCSHGATIGALDEEALFYLRARGIDRNRAGTMLTYAFLRELVDRVPHEALRRRLGESFLARLPRGDSLRELL